MLDEYLERWQLTTDGPTIASAHSLLVPVLQRGERAILKVTSSAEEQRGSRLMPWWDGRGAARVLAHSGEAILLERADDRPSLADLARNGRDDEASLLMCGVVARLHLPSSGIRGAPPPEDVIPLTRWFNALGSAAATHGGLLTLAQSTALALLATPSEVTILHGDIHHGNVLHFGPRGWLAIDPKGLSGERGFDYANLFCNPDHPTAIALLTRRVPLIADAARLERRRLLQWVLAWAGLSAAFSIEDGTSPDGALAVAERTAVLLNQ